MRRTNSGRIVYDRPRHFFNTRDLLRIVRQLPPPDSLREGLQLVGILSEVVLKLLRGILGKFADRLDALAPYILSLIRTMLQMLLENPTLSPEFRERLIQVLSLLY